MIKITFLGTTCMQPTKDRNHSGIHINYEKENILFDCGEGIQRQLRIANLKPSKITKIFISHWHGDHVLGLPGLLSTMAADQYSKKLQIYGPRGIKKYFQFMRKAFPNKEEISVEINELNSGIIFENNKMVLSAEKLNHSITCFGFSLKEKDKLKINSAKINLLGLNGPLVGKLQQGKNIKFEGKIVKSKDYTSRIKGKKISYVADTRPCPGVDRLALNADLLISESTYVWKDIEKAKAHFHMTAKEVGEIAKKNNVKKLVLTHPSMRYKNINIMEKEAKKYFDHKIVFAEDFMIFNV